MIRIRTLPLACLAVLASACQKPALEEQKEAAQAQAHADQVAANQRDTVAAVAASAAREADTQKAAARAEADKKIDEANRQASARVDSAVAAASAKIVDAQAAADREAKQAADAFQKARLDLESGVNKQLDTIDKRTASLRERIASDKSAPPAQAARLKDVETKSKTIRADLLSFETATARSIEAFQSKLERSLDELRKSVDNLETSSKPPSADAR